MYAKAQNVRPTYIKAYDAALADVDVLVMPTCVMSLLATVPRGRVVAEALVSHIVVLGMLAREACAG